VEQSLVSYAGYETADSHRSALIDSDLMFNNDTPSLTDSSPSLLPHDRDTPSSDASTGYNTLIANAWGEQDIDPALISNSDDCEFTSILTAKYDKDQENGGDDGHGKLPTAGWSSPESLEWEMLENKSTDVEKSGATDAGVATANENEEKEEKEEYFPERLLGYKIMSGVKYYKVKWVGYSSSGNTWEPIEHLKDNMGMIEDYHNEHGYSKRGAGERNDSGTVEISKSPPYLPSFSFSCLINVI
jgi:hypothetical protein